MTSREAAWAALHDPRTEPAHLSAIAQEHPEFAAAIAAHPQAYPALREWASAVLSTSPEPTGPEPTGPESTESGPGSDGARPASRRRWVVPVASLCGVAVIAVAATVFVPQIVVSTATTADEGTSTPSDCDDYLARTPDQRAAEFVDESIDKWTESGLTRVPVTSVYDGQCPAHQGQHHPLYDIDTTGDDPRCDVFLGLTADQQRKWAADLATVEYWGLAPARSSVDDLIAGCQDLELPSQNMVRMSNYLVDLPQRMSWQTHTQLGYSWNAVLGVGAPVRGSDVVPLGGHTRLDGSTSRVYTPGSACGFDPATDIVIPLRLLTTSTTNGSDEIPMSAGWTLRVREGAQPISRGFLEASYTSETVCSKAAGASDSARTIVSFDDAASENWSSESFSVVLKDFVSPRFPQGASADLSDFELVATRAGTRPEDPVIDLTPAVIRLDGTRP